MHKYITQFFMMTVVLFVSACGSLPHAPMATVPSADIPSYMGAWYQQALISSRFESMCVADTQAFYTLQVDGDVSVVNRCRTSDGRIEKAVGVAVVVKESAGTKLRVSFFRPFYGDYWILALNPSMKDGWVLIGEPSRQYAGIMSRRPHLNDSDFERAIAIAIDLGYTREQFFKSPQSVPLPAFLD